MPTRESFREYNWACRQRALLHPHPLTKSSSKTVRFGTYIYICMYACMSKLASGHHRIMGSHTRGPRDDGFRQGRIESLISTHWFEELTAWKAFKLQIATKAKACQLLNRMGGRCFVEREKNSERGSRAAV